MISIPPQEAMTKEDENLYLKIPYEIIDQIAERGKFNLVGKLQGIRPNIDLVRRWENTSKD